MIKPLNIHNVPKDTNKQNGQALIILLILLVTGTTSLFVHSVNTNKLNNERDKKTYESLAKAKVALMGQAIMWNYGNGRPGDLPCPDLNDDGVAETSCGNSDGSTGQAYRIGRLPWKTLGLPDLRDGDGERLWYAVSNNFKNNTRTTCTALSSAGCLNSNTIGTISTRQSNGQLILDASSGNNGAIAVILAPGKILRRQGAASDQDRSCTGANCKTYDPCTTSPASLTPKCNPINYLDKGNGEDNASFIDGTADGFISGNIASTSQPNTLIVNDKLLTITASELTPLLEKRVAGEVLACLSNYASGNGGRYPWAAKMNASSAPAYADTTDTLFGRLPDTPFTNTNISNPSMGINWICNIASNSYWWLNWKESVFYGLGNAYKPANTTTPPGIDVYINPTTTLSNKQVVVIIAGKPLSGQSRTTNSDKANPANYLEGFNTGATSTFQKDVATSTFNDYLLFQ
ncbi:hypothetical protein EDC63_13110 [Sulfurirhabdus autotrophica]|uniref:Uncharacterized protein n=1 Tax=Sulfurirhabdus autotrophica TaxID=1706046 RepID=A0A4R3XPR5_9PROT|nr:hypothetical protein EDC63_13110 [Sulfurirhabdus autotrophica]